MKWMSNEPFWDSRKKLYLVHHLDIDFGFLYTEYPS